MKRIFLGAVTAIAVSASAFALTAAFAQSDQQPSRAERMQHWAADHETMLNARLGGMKEALKLTPDQYKLWEPFETAVRDAAKARMENMRKMMENRERMSPVERMDAMAGLMAQGAASLKTISEAAKPFYASLDDAQKRNFALLGREMMMPGHGFLGDTGFSWEPEHWGE